MQDPNSRSSRCASPIHLSTEQKTAFVISYSNVWVVCSIIRFDGARLSYALVRSNCNKLVITCYTLVINVCALKQWLCFWSLQFLAKASRMPVREDEIFAKKSLVAKKNRYKDKCPCE